MGLRENRWLFGRLDAMEVGVGWVRCGGWVGLFGLNCRNALGLPLHIVTVFAEERGYFLSIESWNNSIVVMFSLHIQ
jgi:hypothetical protein